VTGYIIAVAALVLAVAALAVAGAAWRQIRRTS
jgi:hypothetical protein